MIDLSQRSRVSDLQNSRIAAQDSLSDSITDDEFVSAIPTLPFFPAVADRFSSYFATHPYRFQLSHIEKLLQFYNPESDTDPAGLLNLSSVLLSILSFPNQDPTVLFFFISTNFHFTLDRFFPELGSLEIITKLIRISEDVLSFSIDQRYLEKVENLLTFDSPFVLSAIQFIASFACGKRTPKDACGPAILKLIPLIYGQLESDISLAGLTVLRSLVASNPSVLGFIVTRTDFIGFLSSLTPTCPLTLRETCTMLSAAFKSSTALDLFQKEAILGFLIPLLATDDARVVGAAAEVATFLIDDTTATMCHELSFGVRIIELLRADFEYQTQRRLFAVLLKLVTYGSGEHAGALIASGLLQIIDEKIDGIREDLEDEILTAVIVIVRFENEEWIAAIREQNELLQALSEFCDLPDYIGERLLV
jgi:hypothetical protein